MTKTKLEESIERNVASYLQYIQFEVEVEEDLKHLQEVISQIDLWNGAVSIVSFPQSCNMITREWQAILSQSENYKIKFIEMVADELGYMIAKKYFETKMDFDVHLSPYHHQRFQGVESVPELHMEYGTENRNSVNFASDSKTDFILKYAIATDTKILDYCPNSNLIFSSCDDVLLEMEASKILDYLMGLYHQRIVPDGPKQEWEYWMSLYLNRP